MTRLLCARAQRKLLGGGVLVIDLASDEPNRGRKCRSVAASLGLACHHSIRRLTPARQGRQLTWRVERPSPVCRSRARKPQIVRARFNSPAFAFATIPWKYPPGDDRK